MSVSSGHDTNNYCVVMPEFLFDRDTYVATFIHHTRTHCFSWHRGHYTEIVFLPISHPLSHLAF